jgi:hypothetical protein
LALASVPSTAGQKTKTIWGAAINQKKYSNIAYADVEQEEKFYAEMFYHNFRQT